MKNILLLFVFIAFSSFAQSINDYKYVIVPVKFDFQKKENLHRLNTLTKHKLKTMGFTVFYSNEQLPADVVNNRCDKLYVNVVKQSAFMSIKLIVEFKDCNNNVVFTSKSGSSKLKEFEPAFHEALNEAFESIVAQNYSYNGKNIGIVAEAKAQPQIAALEVEKSTESTIPISGQLKAEATASGYLLIDQTSSKIVLRLQKTSDPKIFMASQQSKQGMVILKDNEWFFEYYEDNKLISEQLNISFEN